MPEQYHPCTLCREPLRSTDSPYIFHKSNTYWHSIPLWDACMHAAHGDDARLIRVHRRMGEVDPLLQRAYAGDR